MAAAKNEVHHQALTAVDRLGLRISTMLTAPQAQLDRRLTIHRLDTDEEEAWEAIIELMTEAEGVEVVFNDDGSVTVNWERPTEDDFQVAEGEELLVLSEEALD